MKITKFLIGEKEVFISYKALAGLKIAKWFEPPRTGLSLVGVALGLEVGVCLSGWDLPFLVFVCAGLFYVTPQGVVILLLARWLRRVPVSMDLNPLCFSPLPLLLYVELFSSDSIKKKHEKCLNFIRKLPSLCCRNRLLSYFEDDFGSVWIVLGKKLFPQNLIVFWQPLKPMQ